MMQKILVAEDDHALSEPLCRGLAQAGFEPHPVFDGEAALAHIKNHQPDLVLLDVMMPKLDGIGVLRALNQISVRVPVIVLTNMGDAQTVSNILQAGGSDYLLKSDQSIDQVVAKVKEVLARDAQHT